jgi:HD-GYP domain-containing protein (c-di-GMP phosphodiesterase class II)
MTEKENWMPRRSGISDSPSDFKSAEPPGSAADKSIEGFTAALNELKEIIRDLTFQKEMEAAAARRYKTLEQHYKELFNGGPGGSLVTDSKAIIQESNQVAANLLQTDQDFLQGNNLIFFVIQADHEKVFALMDQALQANAIPGKIVHLRSPEGPLPIFLASAGRRDQAGEVVGFQWLLHLHPQSGPNEAALKNQVTRLEICLAGLVKAFSNAVEMQDPYASGHQRRVAQLAVAIAQELGFSGDRLAGMELMGLLHDIGNAAIPPMILNKVGRLTVTETNILKTHPQLGYDLLKDVEFPWPLAQAILQHHERWNGSGYPAGLAGDDIIIEASILAVAEVVEAMVSPRVYGEALGIEKALEEIYKEMGVLYDPQVVNATLKLFVEKGFKFA